MTLDTTSPDGFSCYVTSGDVERYTGFNQTTVQADALKLGRCEVDELPAWLAKAAKKLRTKWNFSQARAQRLRGARLATLMAWLGQVK